MNVGSYTLLQRYSQKGKALTFGDVTLADHFCDFNPNDVSLTGRITKKIQLKGCPILSAAMDTVTEEKMALKMAENGCIGIVHRNLSVDEQVAVVKRIRRRIHYRGMIPEPVFFYSNQRKSDIDAKNFEFQSFPIVNLSGQLTGLITKESFQFYDFTNDPNPLLRNVMKPLSELVVMKVDKETPATSVDDAYQLMLKHHIKQIPVIHADTNELYGMYTFNDVKEDQRKKELYSLDEHGNFLVGAAVGPTKNERERIDRLVEESGCPLLVIDCSHGACTPVLDQLKYIKQKYSEQVEVIAGNVCSQDAALRLLHAEHAPDGIKVGISPGASCTTREVTGHGMPQIQAIFEVYTARRLAKKEDVPIIADGGISCSGDIVKAFAAGADAVMLGSLLAATYESPGEMITRNGKNYKMYRGMGSREAMQERLGSRTRYNASEQQKNNYNTLTNEEKIKLTPEGISGYIECTSSVEVLLHNLFGGIRAGFAHSGGRTITQFRKSTTLWRQTQSGFLEGRPQLVSTLKV